MSWEAELRERLSLLQLRAQRITSSKKHGVDALLNDHTLWPEPNRGGDEFWSGEREETTWQNLRATERALLEAEGGDAVAAVIPRLLARLDALSAKDQRRELLKAPLTRIYRGWAESGKLGEGQDADVLALFDEVYAASDDHHRDVRALRNLLIGSAMWLCVAVAVVAFAHAVDPGFISLCRDGGAKDVCVAGSRPRALDVLQLALVGALGGLLGAVIPLSTSRSIRSRYNVRAAQIALKPALGAGMAVVGVLLVQAGLTGAQKPASDELLAYAALFGTSQQFFTTFVDVNVNKVLGKVKRTKA